MGLALEEPTDKDEVFHADGFDFVIAKDVASILRGVRIDHRFNKYIGKEMLVRPA